ncbi:MAG: hypothetical protein J6Q22_10490 [Prevotella sp.]|nr:hypothetical protein [Prevotella sp.]
MRKSLSISISLLSLLSAIGNPIRSNIGSTHIVYSQTIEQSYTVSDYVQNGLVAIWDGIENEGWGNHSNSTTIWKDLVGGIELVASGDATWSDSYLIVRDQWITSDKDAFSYLQSNFFDPPKLVGGGYTIELVVRITSTGNKNIFGSRYSTVNIFTYGGKICGWIGSGNNTISFLEINSKGSVSFCLDNIGGTYDNVSYTNGKISNRYSNRSYGGTLTGSFGVGKGEYQAWGVAEGEYYCIRLYGRVLTPDEITFNNMIDKARFGL